MADLAPYYDHILSDEDKPLFKEAMVSAKEGALRGAYILVWLAAAEGLKRKFREASLRDGGAGVYLGKIAAAEAKRASADKLILSASKNYGFIDDAAEQKLEHVYDMRCLYGHPYEAAPTEIELLGAVEIVVTEVLAKPTLMKRGFIQNLLANLYDDINFLANTKASVHAFADEITPRIDPNEYAYLLTEYAKKLEPTSDDPSIAKITARGRWVLGQFLLRTGCGFYTEAQWHNFASTYPKTAQSVLLTSPALLSQIGDRARHYVISFTLNNADERPWGLRWVELLNRANRLTADESAVLTGLSIHTLAAAGLGLDTAFNAIIAALKSRDWYKQNPAAAYVRKAGPDQIERLSAPEQELLGRNILQAADGGSGEAIACLRFYGGTGTTLPTQFVKGMIFECFVKETPVFRLKTAEMATPLELTQNFPGILAELVETIERVGESKWVRATDFDKTLDLLNDKPALGALKSLLIRKRSSLQTVDDTPPMETTDGD